MLNTILLIIILIVACNIYYSILQIKKEIIQKNKTEINNKYLLAYNKYIPYHNNGMFNNVEDKNTELFKVLNEKKLYDIMDDLMGGIWYSCLVKEVDNILKK